jgi:hypothetical protein
MSRITPSGRLDGDQPDIVVAFASISDGCDKPIACVAVIADTPLAEGEGISNSFSRAGTWTFMAARGPDFQQRMTDWAPTSNADIARTVAELLNLDVEPTRGTPGRVLTEALAGSRYRSAPPPRMHLFKSPPSIEGLITTAQLLSFGTTSYFHEAVKVLEVPAPARAKPDWPRLKAFTIGVSGGKY